MKFGAQIGALIGLAGVIVTHFLDLGDKLAEAHYMAALFIALMAGSFICALLIVVDRHAVAALRAGAVLAALTIVGFVLSRTVGLPQIEDHVGQWDEPVGVASLIFEFGLVAVALRTLAVPVAQPALAPAR